MHLCQGDALLTGPQDPPDCQKQLKKKQKNRVAAQRSRQKHTDKADALHQHESLEKHNRTLQKEIQALQAELERWTRTLQLHQRLCRLDCASHPAPGPAGCWGQAEQPPGQPAARGQHGCRKQQGLLQSPAASPPAHTLDPGPHPQDSPGLLPPLLPVLPLGPAVVTVPPAQPSPRPDLSASPTGSGLLETFSKLSAILPSPPAQPAPPQPLGLEHPTRGDLGSSSHHASAAPGPAFLQRREQKPVRWAADWPAPAVEPSPHPLLAFPLLSSAQVHF
ncbi:basic leucine zipper transcriptional factor ATF-like 2 isoform X3 [Sciurus carolinensis]|uniref:basic leucine zipper transcriptional factor ATF-like 2 isoform X3 n=1 Tax=Sciurus carolinensis TaxID=30640 RepID=UPI001FB36344|nr:basic leucine zipper transcriptional factor ATF-like 2 isoform X3 [Sciurus carolinensis]